MEGTGRQQTSRHIIYSSGGESDGKSGDDGRDGDDVDESGGEESDGKEGDRNMMIEPDCKFLWDVKV